MELTETITIFVSIVALFIPLLLSSYDKNSKLRKAVYLKELIKTRDDLNQILIETDINKQQILHEKLESMLSDINKEVNASKTGFSKTFELFSLGLISCFLIYFSAAIHSNSPGINEGIFTHLAFRGLLSIVIVFFSIIFTNILVKKLRIFLEGKLPVNDWRLYYLRIPLLALVYPLFHFAIMGLLRLSDKFVSLF
jgi:hypothetical protein